MYVHAFNTTYSLTFTRHLQLEKRSIKWHIPTKAPNTTTTLNRSGGDAWLFPIYLTNIVELGRTAEIEILHV